MSPSPHRKWLRIASVTLALGLIVYMIVLPAVDAARQRFQPQPTMRVLEDLSFAEQARVRTAEAFTAIWFFAVGAAIGSFLNVVVYRLPRRQSLVWQRSHCPACGGAIAGRDNLPILSYLLLGGRCRACRAPISFRYPLVELTTAALFLLLYLVQLISGGANLPVRDPNHYRGVVWIIFYTKWDLVGLYFYHGYLFCVLFAWALIQADGHRMPGRAQLIALVIAVAAPLVWPHLLLVPLVHEVPSALTANPRFAALASIAAGSVCGLVVGGWLRWCCSRPSLDTGSPIADDPMIGCVLLGVGLGWQAVLSIAVGALVLGCLTALGSRWIRRGWQIPMLGILFAAALLHQIVWRVGVHHAAPWWPGPDSGIVHLLVPVGCLLLLGLAARRLRRLPDRVSDPGVSDPGMSDPGMSDLGDVSAEVGDGWDGGIPDGEP